MKLLGGGLLAFLALFMLLGLVASDTPRTLAVTAMTFVVVVLTPAIGAGALVYSHVKDKRSLAAQQRARLAQDLQTEIVRAAHRAGGKVTVAELVAELGADVEAVQAALERLVGLSVADVHVTESGLLVYAFPEIERLSEKDSSRGVLDA